MTLSKGVLIGLFVLLIVGCGDNLNTELRVAEHTWGDTEVNASAKWRFISFRRVEDSPQPIVIRGGYTMILRNTTSDTLIIKGLTLVFQDSDGIKIAEYEPKRIFEFLHADTPTKLYLEFTIALESLEIANSISGVSPAASIVNHDDL